jgi:hypothetical protein
MRVVLALGGNVLLRAAIGSLDNAGAVLAGTSST